MELMTERRAAEVLLVDRSTLAKWRKAGIAPKHLVLNGKSIRYRMEDLMNFVNESYNDEESETTHV